MVQWISKMLMFQKLTSPLLPYCKELVVRFAVQCLLCRQIPKASLSFQSLSKILQTLVCQKRHQAFEVYRMSWIWLGLHLGTNRQFERIARTRFRSSLRQICNSSLVDMTFVDGHFCAEDFAL